MGLAAKLIMVKCMMGACELIVDAMLPRSTHVTMSPHQAQSMRHVRSGTRADTPAYSKNFQYP